MTFRSPPDPGVRAPVAGGAPRAPRVAGGPGFTPVPVDRGVCAACGAEIADPTGRRFGYPFTTCAACGPRYSIAESAPWRREGTSLRAFDMCPECAEEVRTPGDRREGSQTNACPTCGPRPWLADPTGHQLAVGPEALAEAIRRLLDGKILGVRGSGGVHLVADATHEESVERLRRRTGRSAKPMGVMVSDLEGARELAYLSEAEARLLASPARPMLILRRRPDAAVAVSLAPGLDTVGVLVADTALRRLLVERTGRPLVVTSGRLAGEPVVAGVRESIERLGHAVDAFLFHDQEIVARCDDSVARVAEEAPVLLRRARGWVPRAVPLPIAAPEPLVALGSSLETTFTLAEGGSAYPSPRLGDLEELGTLDQFRRTLEHCERLHGIEPRVLVREADAGRLALRLGRTLEIERSVSVDHDHAHVAAVAGEHGVRAPVVGVVYEDRSAEGDGRRGTRIVVADLRTFKTVAHVRFAPSSGSTVTLGSVASLADSASVVGPGRSSLGGLFGSAASVLAGQRGARYEGEASLLLESLAGDHGAAPLPFPRSRKVDEPWTLDPRPLLEELSRRRSRGEEARRLAAGFHESVAEATADLVGAVCAEHRIEIVALAGDMFHNVRLLVSLARRLGTRGLRVLRPRRLPPNDGAISYGQAVVAAARLTRAEEV